MWLCDDVTTSTKSRRSGATTRRLVRTCGEAVSAYLRVSESDRYGSSSRWRPSCLSRNPLWPSHHRPRLDTRDVGEQRVVGLVRLDHSVSRTRATPAHMFASFAFAAQRAVWLSPQSGASESFSAGACSSSPRTRSSMSSGVST